MYIFRRLEFRLFFLILFCSCNSLDIVDRNAFLGTWVWHSSAESDVVILKFESGLTYSKESDDSKIFGTYVYTDKELELTFKFGVLKVTEQYTYVFNDGNSTLALKSKEDGALRDYKRMN